MDEHPSTAVPPLSLGSAASAAAPADRVPPVRVQGDEVNCMLCRQNLLHLRTSRCLECDRGSTQGVSTDETRVHPDCCTVITHTRCIGCGYDLAGLPIRWPQRGEPGKGFYRFVICPECGSAQDAPDPLPNLAGLPLRLGRRPVRRHVACIGCGEDLIGRRAEWFRRDNSREPQLRWTVVCAECDLRQDAPEAPQATLVNSLVQRKGATPAGAQLRAKDGNLFST